MMNTKDMLRIFDDFKTYPVSVQKGLVLLLLSWIWFYAALGVVADIRIPNRMLLTGVFVLLLAGSMKNWARLLCIMCNGMAFLFCLTYAFDVYRLAGGSFGTLPVTLLLGAGLFALSAYYLLIKPSAEFYKTYNHKPSEPENR